MTLSFSRLFSFSGHLSWPFAANGARRAAPWLRTGRAVLDPEALPESLQRDLGLLDGRGPSNRRPERDPRLGPWHAR